MKPRRGKDKLNVGLPIPVGYSLDDVVRFLWRCREVHGHWLWVGETDKKGYGSFWYKRKRRWAHRFAYTVFVGPIPEGMTVNHIESCRQPACVRPAHLELLSNPDNAADGNRARGSVPRLQVNGDHLVAAGEAVRGACLRWQDPSAEA